MNIQTTYGAAGTDTVHQPARGALAAVRRALRGVVKSMLAAHWERETVRELSALPTSMLQDIGMTRGNIRGVAAALARERAENWARQAGASNGFGG